MNSSYTILSSIIVALLIFLYLSWLFVSAKFAWKNDQGLELKRNPRRWKNFVDSKNEDLGWFDLGNHIIILGVIFFAIFILKNDRH